MTIHSTFTNAVDYDSLAARFRPIFARIGQGAEARERERSLPVEQIGWLKQAGFGAVRVPLEQGGGGASLVQLVRLWIELAAADSNLTQALRGHFAFVEDRLNAPPGPDRERWLARFADGQLVGNGWTEVGAPALGEVQTKVTPEGEHWRLDGAKYYSTGSIFADWIDVYAERADTGGKVIAAVSTHQPGVQRSDDWDGFGQRTTGSGTSLFDGARVERDDLIDFASRFVYQTAFYQLNLVSVLVGIGRAIERDLSGQVRDRKRIYSHGNGPRAAEDPQVLQVVGQISAQVYAAEAVAISAAEAAQRVFDAHLAGDVEARHAANIEAELASAKAQLVVAELVLRSATELFDALGASAVRVDQLLDRHWRNARTAASHNPLIYKARIIGDWAVNRTEPPLVWKVGRGCGQTS